jgi:glycolate oxidase iron-sulfur subunit
MRRNIDAWWPTVASGAVEAIVMNASGCGVTVKEYGHALARDPHYATKAGRIADLTRDLSELLPDLVEKLRPLLALARSAGERGAGPERRRGRIAFHPPCTLQHGQRLRGGVEAAMTELGFDIRVATNESHLCCGSAGTYSVLQPTLAQALRDRKLGHLGELAPETIVSANIGCIQHLQSGTTIPVRHWVELLDDALAR